MAKTKKTAKAAKKTASKAKAKKAASKAKKVAKKSAPKKAAKPVAKKAVKKVAKKAAPKPVEKKVAVAPKKSPSVKVAERPAVPNLNTFFPPITQRPIAHKPAKKISVPEDKTRYSDEELKEFETLILEKLEKARGEYKILKETLNRNNDEGTDATSGGNTKVLEDGAETAEKENLSQLAARQQKYITNLENALVRIKNGTYGICSVTGKLIPKERLIAVPHTTQSIEAKMMKKD
jgi:RNA polymerase-binding transcription factor DksA